MSDNNQLTYEDIHIAAQVIEVATKKGVLDAKDLVVVGTTYKRLIAAMEAFKKEVEKQQEEEKAKSDAQ